MLNTISPLSFYHQTMPDFNIVDYVNDPISEKYMDHNTVQSKHINRIDINHINNYDNNHQVGWLYITESQTNLRKYHNWNTLWVVAHTPDDMVLHTMISPRQVGYGMDSPIPDTVCSYLITQPTGPNGGEIEIPGYIITKAVQYLYYRP